MVNGTYAYFFPMLNISVLQGSILGSFFSYFNKWFDELVSFENTELLKIGIWLRSNKLLINASKTKLMIFIQRVKFFYRLDFFSTTTILMFLLTPNWFILSERIHAFKILGVYVDENLTFDYHIKTSLNKISKFMFSLNKIKNFLLTSALKSIYYALVHLHVFYCLPVVSCTSKKKI